MIYKIMINTIYTNISNFILNYIIIVSNINLINILIFLKANSYLLLFCIIIYLLITDDRFTWSRKIIFILLLLTLIILGLLINKAPYLIIKDLFWYSLILNGSFIIHTLILDRIFFWCWKNNYEYLGFLVSRISFTLSFSGIYYLFNKFYYSIIYPFIWTIHFNNIDFIEEKKMQDNQNWAIPLKYRYSIFYMNLVGNNWNFINIIKNFGKILVKPISIIQTIILHFIIIFHNYSLVLMGKSKPSFNYKIIIIWILFFILALLIGIPRLYVLWIFQFIFEMWRMFNHDYHEINTRKEFKALSFLDKIKYTLKNFKKINYLSKWFNVKYKELEEIYEKPYHKFFMFDLLKFFRDKYNDGYSFYHDIWGIEDTIYENGRNPLVNTIKFPILKIYEFYPWEEIAKGYYITQDIINKAYDQETSLNVRLSEAFAWCSLINRDINFLVKLDPKLANYFKWMKAQTEEDFIHWMQAHSDENFIKWMKAQSEEDFIHWMQMQAKLDENSSKFMQMQIETYGVGYIKEMKGRWEKRYIKSMQAELA